jgi:hypothetical protein
MVDYLQKKEAIQVVEHMPRKHEALNSNPSISKRKKKGGNYFPCIVPLCTVKSQLL